MLSQNTLHEVFDYDPELGALIWKECHGRRHKGQIAGTIKPNGYGQISYKDGLGPNRVYSVHRLIWVYHRGDIPAGLVIDHIDRNPRNNLINNLRLATPYENACNTSHPNKHGFRGVTKRKNRWITTIKIKGEIIQVGSFKTLEEAAEARRWADDLYRPNAVIQ
jgi:hypothetical protein